MALQLLKLLATAQQVRFGPQGPRALGRDKDTAAGARVLLALLLTSHTTCPMTADSPGLHRVHRDLGQRQEPHRDMRLQRHNVRGPLSPGRARKSR